jgi:hypothetical protein
MKIITKVWTIADLYKLKSKINPKPQYQRTAVWQPAKRKLLIDSILRGYDIPKFYLRETPLDLIYKYEVTDGQQRILAIWDFIENLYELDEALIGTLNTKDLNYHTLKKNQKKLIEFNNYEVNVTLIKEANQDEIRTLFARLQMGERLNPAELRHALSSNIGNAIASIVENHNFFDKDCKIVNYRYKHQDYLDNSITLSYYDATRNIKAVDMKFLYTECANLKLNEMQPLLKKVNNVLDIMRKINSHKKGIFKNKWAFVDVFYLLYKNFEKIKEVRPKKFAENFGKFEAARKTNNSAPEILIEDKTSLNYDKDLYDYIIAFKTSGADKNNTKIRYRVLCNKFFNKTNLELNP